MPVNFLCFLLTLYQFSLVNQIISHSSEESPSLSLDIYKYAYIYMKLCTSRKETNVLLLINLGDLA